MHDEGLHVEGPESRRARGFRRRIAFPLRKWRRAAHLLATTMTTPASEPIDNDLEKHKDAQSVQEEPLELLLPRYLSIIADASEHLSAEIIGAVLPILWSFLLEPGSIKDPASHEETCVDFKSITSLLFVDKRTKDSFDACNGRVMCVRAWNEELFVKGRYLQENIASIYETFCQREWSHTGTIEEKQLLDSLLNKVRDLKAVWDRLAFILLEQLHGHFAEEYSAESQQLPAEYAEMYEKNIEGLFSHIYGQRRLLDPPIFI